MSQTTESKLVDLCEDGTLSWRQVALACLAYMSEDQITDMAHVEELILLNEMEEVFFDVSIELENGGHQFLQRFDAEEYSHDDESFTLATEYASDYSAGNKVVTVVVERVTDNGGSREEVQRFELEVDEDDGQPDEAQEWHDFDPDC